MAFRYAVAVLREVNWLAELSACVEAVGGADGAVELSFDLPMPGVSYLELACPEGNAH